MAINESDDPLHQETTESRTWTRVNLAETLSGVMTPLDWTFWSPVQEVGMFGAWHELGVFPRSRVRVHPRIEDRTAAIFFGRPAINLSLVRTVYDRLPGISSDAFESMLMGEVGGVGRSTRARYAVIAAKLPISLLRLPGRVARAREDIHRWWQLKTGSGRPDDFEAALGVLRESPAAFLQAWEPFGIAGTLSQIIYEQVRRLAENAGQEDRVGTLVTGYGGVDETEELKALWEVARGHRPRDRFLAEFGFHGPESGKLSRPSWRQDPSALETVLEGMRGRSEDDSPGRREERQAARREQAEAELLRALPWSMRPRARMLLTLARRYIPLRETTKATFIRTLDVARCAIRVLAAHLATSRSLADPEDVFYLTFDEVASGAIRKDALEVVARRRAKREEYLGLELPDFWTGAPEPLPIGTHAAGPRRIQALGVSPGVVEGRVRVVLDPSRDECPEPGEILVCPMTNPSWASVLTLSAAAVIEMGGMLSHGAIVARELGIPCVINARGATRLFRTGDLVRVDGSSGTAEIVEDSNAMTTGELSS